MNDLELREITHVQEFVAGCAAVSFKPASSAEGYKWIAGTLKKYVIY